MMIHFSRLKTFTFLLVAGGLLAAAPMWAFAPPLPHMLPLLHSAPPGYLGVGFQDVDSERSAKLKLKDKSGAEVVTVDHDAPAGRADIRLHDVILQLNGQAVEGSEQLSHALHEIPAGRNVVLVLSRDGQPLTVNVQLADRAKVEESWVREHYSPARPDDSSLRGGFLPSGHGAAHGSNLLGVFTPNPVYIGAEVGTLTRQMADFFGVTEGQGILVQSVDNNSPAAVAGLKAGDVITKINRVGVISAKDWQKEINSHKGKQVELTIVRNKREQTLSLVAGDPKKKA